MKLKLLLFTLLLSIAVEAQITKTEAYLIGTKISFYPNECGNAIPEAAGKLTFCDASGNLGVVESSTGLNQRTVRLMLDNRANQDEVFITSAGLSIKKEDGTYENVPNIAVPDDYITGAWRNDAVIYSGLVMPNNKIIFSTNSYALHEYDRDAKTITSTELGSIHYPRAFAYDADRDLAWVIAIQSNTRHLYNYTEVTGLNYVGELTDLSAAQISSNTSATLIYKDDHLYLGATNGLHKINVNTLTSTAYNTLTTPGLPHDRVNDLKFDANGDLWLANREANDGSIVKFDVANEAYEQYQLPRIDNPSFNYYFQKLDIDDTGTLWAVASNFTGLIKLDFDAQSDPIWDPITSTALNEFGVGTVFVPNNVYYRNNKFYFTSANFSSGVSNSDEILINDNNNWSSISDNESGNTSYLANNRYNFNLPDDEGGMWWFNHFDDIITHRTANDELFVFSDFENLGNTAAIDIDNNPIARLGAPGFNIRKIDLPLTYSIIDQPSQNTTGLVRYKDQIWWFNNSTLELKILKYNQVIATFDLDNSYQSVFYFDVDSNGDAWFAKNIAGELIIKKFDTATETTTDFMNPLVGQIRDVTSGPNGNVWFSTQLAIIHYDGTNFTTYFTSDYPELYNIQKLVVDDNGVAYALLNDNAAITKIENAGTPNVTFSLMSLENANSIVPALDHYRPDDLSIDNQGAIWTNASNNTFKIIDDDLAKEYRVEGETYEFSGSVYNDINENDVFDEGEEYPGQMVALKINEQVYSTFTDANGMYRFYLYEDNATYEITLPTIGQFVTASNRQLLVSVEETDQNYDGNDFELEPKFINSLYVKSSSKTGAWGFVRDNFENTYTTAIGNISASKTFNNLEVTYVFKNQDENSTNVLPSIDDVKVYELNPNGSIQLIQKVTIDQLSNKWLVNAEPNTYTQTLLPLVPEVTEMGSQTDIKITIPTVSPLNTYIIEIDTGLYDPVSTGEVINHGVSEIDSEDFEDNNGMPLGNPIILIPLENRNGDSSGYPFEFDDTPYINPEDVYGDPPYLQPKQVYGPGPYTTTIFSSYDPNDKLVDEGVSGVINDRHIGRKWLTYTIRFENTGNFSAKDVVITDIIDANLDPNSVKVIESSHNYTVDILRNAENRSILKFSFNDIFLPFDDANNDGYIKFLIKADEDILENTIVDNVANIYFDQNPAIITNVIQVRFLTIESLSVKDEYLEAQLKVYPNPTSESINIQTELVIKSIELYSIRGNKVLQTEQSKVDVSGLATGTYIVKINTEVGVISKKLIIN